MGGGGSKDKRCSGLHRKRDETIGGGLHLVREVSSSSRVWHGRTWVVGVCRGRREGGVDGYSSRQAGCRGRSGARRGVRYAVKGCGGRPAGARRRPVTRPNRPPAGAGATARGGRRPCTAARRGRSQGRDRRGLGERSKVVSDCGRKGDEGGIGREAVVSAGPRYANVSGHCTEALLPRSKGATADCFGRKERLVAEEKPGLLARSSEGLRYTC